MQWSGGVGNATEAKLRFGHQGTRAWEDPLVRSRASTQRPSAKGGTRFGGRPRYGAQWGEGHCEATWRPQNWGTTCGASREPESSLFLNGSRYPQRHAYVGCIYLMPVTQMMIMKLVLNAYSVPGPVLNALYLYYLLLYSVSIL